MTDPSPYDTGARAEPKVWLPHGTKVDQATPAENFGKVDFDNDSAETLCTVYVEKNPDGSHTVHIQSMVELGELSIMLGAGD